MDTDLPDEIKRRWEKWLKNIPIQLTMPRAIPREIHGFADGSFQGYRAVIYAVVKQLGRISQGFLVSKAMLVKRDLTIPRLELVSCHMVSNLLHNTLNVVTHLRIAGVFA